MRRFFESSFVLNSMLLFLLETHLVARRCWLVVPVVPVVLVVPVGLVGLVFVTVVDPEQPQLLPLPEGGVSHLQLRPRPAQLRRRRAAVLEAQPGLGASFFGEVQPIRSRLQRGQAEVTAAQFTRLQAHALAAVYGAGWENGGHHGSEALSGPGGGDGLGGGVGQVHPSHGLAPEVVGLHLFFSLGLSVDRKH